METYLQSSRVWLLSKISNEYYLLWRGILFTIELKQWQQRLIWSMFTICWLHTCRKIGKKPQSLFWHVPQALRRVALGAPITVLIAAIWGLLDKWEREWEACAQGGSKWAELVFTATLPDAFHRSVDLGILFLQFSGLCIRSSMLKGKSFHIL